MDKNKYMTEKIRNKNMKATPYYAIGVIMILFSVLIFSDDTIAIIMFIVGVIFLVATILITNRFLFTRVKDIKKTNIKEDTDTKTLSKREINEEKTITPPKKIEKEIKKETAMDRVFKRKQEILASVDIKRKIRKI